MKLTIEELRKNPLPEHIAIIMDGNGRWAKRQGLPRLAGHRIGVQALKNVVMAFDELNIKYLTVYAFSTENWKRPADEIDGLMELIVEFLDKEIDYLDAHGVCVHPIGDVSVLTGKARDKILAAYERTKENNNIIFNVALNYGGRQEIIRGIKQLCQDVQDNKCTIDEIDEKLFNQYLYTANQPDPDLLIRSSGELRISNFLLWQIAYTEMWVSDVMWPDFSKQDLWRAIYDYQNRERRYGGLGK
ncbi:MAG: isoprenyl transferase [Peptococcaceae bacterium]|nr:isoprenyl transferase [Peptococcaceae bacterium]